MCCLLLSVAWNHQVEQSEEHMPNTEIAPATSRRLTYTVEEAASLLGISRGLAYEMVRQGALPALRLGQRRLLVPVASLEEWLSGSGKAPHAARPGPDVGLRTLS